MSDDSPLGIDTSGDMPALKPRELISALSATIWWGWEAGLLVVIQGVGDAVESGLRDLEAWLSDSLLGALVPTDLIAEAFATNAAWVRGLGVLGLPVAIVEVVAFIILASWVLRGAGQLLLTVLPGGGS